MILVKDPAYFRDIFCIGIVGSGFSPGSGKLVQYDPAACIGAVLLLKDLPEGRIIGRADIGGKHAAVFQRPAVAKLRKLSHSFQKLRHTVLKESGLHTGGTDASDLFLVHQQTAGCSCRCLCKLQDRQQRGVGADTVVLSISRDHAAVQSAFSGFSCRNHLQLRGEEILFFKIIFFFQDAKDILFDSLFFLFVCLCRQRSAADQDIQLFSFDYLSRFFLHLLGSQMRKKIADVQDRIVFILPDHNIQDRTVFFCHNAVDRKRKGHPLVFLDSAVIMRVQISQVRILIQRVLLDIQSGRIDVCTKNIHPLCDIFRSHMIQRDGLFHAHIVQLVAGHDLFAAGKFLLQAYKTGSLRLPDRLRHTFSFGFTLVQKIPVGSVHRFQFLQLCLRIVNPSVSSFHYSVSTFLID